MARQKEDSEEGSEKGKGLGIMVKAFMSERGHDEPLNHNEHELRTLRGWTVTRGFSDAQQAVWALDEASRILAETEPNTPEVIEYTEPWGAAIGWQHDDFFMRQSPWCALAESLAAFVEGR